MSTNGPDELYEALTITKVTQPTIGKLWRGCIIDHIIRCNQCHNEFKIEKFIRNSWAFYIKQSHRNSGIVDEYFYNNDDQLHRIYGPAYINRYAGIEVWTKNGILHRDDGPAVNHKSQKLMWFRNGVLHRDDGPAIVDIAGPARYYIDGIKYSPKEYKKEINRRKRK